MRRIEMRVTPEGATAIYDDAIADHVQALGGVVSRASHVEPDPEHVAGGNWYVDLRPAGGVCHWQDAEGRPFMTRKAAIAFELEWLRNNVILASGRTKK